MSSGIPGKSAPVCVPSSRGPARFANLAALRKITRAPGAEPVISFGNVLDPGRPVHGGAVKLPPSAKGPAFRQATLQYPLRQSAAPNPTSPWIWLTPASGPASLSSWNQNSVAYPAGPRRIRAPQWPHAPTCAPRRTTSSTKQFCRTSAEKFLGPSPGSAWGSGQPNRPRQIFLPRLARPRPPASPCHRNPRLRPACSFLRFNACAL